MKITNVKLTIFMFLLAFGVNSQILKEAEVRVVLSMGELDYAIISETGTSNYYKTSIYAEGELLVNEQVKLNFNSQSDYTPSVVAEGLSNTLYSELIGNESRSIAQPPLENMPSIENEILFFNDESAALKYYNSLSAYINDTITGDTIVEEKLDLFEEYYSGYTSWRTSLNDRYDWDNNSFDDDQIASIEAEDFVNDVIQKTFLNKNRLVGIGDRIYYFHKENVKIDIDKNDEEALQILIDIEDGDNLTGTGSPVMFLERFNIHAPQVDLYATKSSITNPEVRKVELTPVVNNISCSIYKKTLYLDMDYCTWENGGWTCGNYNLGVPWDVVTVTVDWDDGTPLETIVGYHGADIEHTYSATGTYYPKTTAQTFLGTLIDGNGTSGTNIVINVGNACSGLDHHEDDEASSGNWKMTTKLWVSNNSFGNHIGGYTHAWKKDGSGWKRKSAKINVIIDGVFRDESCNPKASKHGDAHRNNQRRVEKIKTKLWKHFDIGNGDVHSEHNLKKGGVEMVITMSLSPC